MGGGSMVNWAWVQPEVARATRVCSYDRAGYGWSEPGPGPSGPRAAATDLHTVLSRAGVAGPYVLVGHSLGGVIVRQFAADHPSDVAGIVLLDAAHPDQYARHPEYLKEIKDLMPLIRWAPLLARLGLMRLYVATGDGFDFGELPARPRAELAAEWSSSQHWDRELAMLSTAESFYAEAQSLGKLGEVPLVVITAGDNSLIGWKELQVELAALSTNSVHRTVEGATHVSLAFNPQHAGATSRAILDLLPAGPTGAAPSR
jgi:pimeloyl-ACP methyl ester carboxylesterase